MVVQGKLPQGRNYIRQYLTDIREGLVRDKGPTEKDLTTAELILIDRIVTKLGIVRCIEEHCRETVVMEKGELVPSLGKNYITYCNSVRSDLRALGIEGKVADDVIDLGTYIKSKADQGES